MGNTDQPDRCDSSLSWVAVRLCQAAQATACSAPTLRRPPMTTALPQARWRGSAADTSPALPTWTPRQQQRWQTALHANGSVFRAHLSDAKIAGFLVAQADNPAAYDTRTQTFWT